jgi:NAD(P)-dependent dehydrogenase (short-subunit alcohol dehydrogenase family)
MAAPKPLRRKRMPGPATPRIAGVLPLGRETARRLIEEGHTVYIGVRSVERGQAAAAGLGARFVHLDVTDDASVQAVFDTNVVGVVRVTQAALPLLRKSDNPVVVNISSALGSFWAVTNPERPQSHAAFVVYGASKAAVSMLTVQYAKALPEIKVNAVEPGFTATDFTADFPGGRPVEESAEGIVRMATIGKDGPTGTFQEDDHELSWWGDSYRAA